MTAWTRGAAAYFKSALYLCALCLALFTGLARPCAAQEPAGTGHVKSKVDADFTFPAADWSFLPAGADYFSDFKDMKMNLYATSNGCSIDAFVMLDGERVGFLGTYMVSMQDFFANRGAETDEQYEIWRGTQGNRVVGKLVVMGPADKAGTMHNRSAGATPYRNVIYMILNNMNLMRLTFSAPAKEWADDACRAKIDRVVNSFVLKGDADPREERVINGMASRITADRTKEAPTPSNTGNPAPIDNSSNNTAPDIHVNTAPPHTDSNTAANPSPDQFKAIIDKLDALTVRMSTLESDQKKLLEQIEELSEQIESGGGDE
jgi:hypothetical protein